MFVNRLLVKYKIIYYRPNGSALLIALMIMTGVIAVSAGTANLVLTEVKQSSAIDRASLAYYAAESGVEKSIFYMRKKGTDANFFDHYNETLPSNAKYTLSTSKTETAVFAAIKQDKSYQLDLYGNGELLPIETPIKAIKLECTSKPNALLEVSWVSWKVDGTINEPQSETQLVDCKNGGWVINLNNLTNDLYYTMRLTARYDDVDDLQVTAYSQENPTPSCGCQIAMPTHIIVKSVGMTTSSEGKVSQAITISIPLRDPVLGVFDHVIFSEETLEKNYE